MYTLLLPKCYSELRAGSLATMVHSTSRKIGDSYTKAHVPYVGIRALPAFMGGVTVPIVFSIMKETGFPTAIACFSAALVAFGT